MKNILSNTLILLALLMIGCSKNVEFLDEIDIAKTAVITFPLDKETSRKISNLQYSEELNSIIFYNDANGSIYFYNLETKENWLKVKVNFTGPNGVGRVDKFFVKATDSIYIVNSLEGNLYTLNSNSEVYQKVKLLDETDPTPVDLYSPIQFFNDHFYLLSRGQETSSDELSKKSLIRVSEKDLGKSYFMDAPGDVTETKWNSMGARSYGTLIPGKNLYTFSYPQLDELHFVDLENDSSWSVYAGSLRLGKPKAFGRGSSDLEAKAIYQMSNPWYHSVYYDPHTKLIFRTASVAREVDKSNLFGVIHPTIHHDDVYVTTVVLDEEFKKVAEVEHMTFLDNIFSTREGVFVINNSYEPDNEDILAFSKYEISKD